MRSLYTDNAALFPEDQQTIWWEVWLRSGTRTVFDIAVQQLRLPMREHALTFPTARLFWLQARSSNWGKLSSIPIALRTTVGPRYSQLISQDEQRRATTVVR